VKRNNGRNVYREEGNESNKKQNTPEDGGKMLEPNFMFIVVRSVDQYFFLKKGKSSVSKRKPPHQ